MRIERKRNAMRNITFGVVLKIYQMLIPFIMRTAMIYLLGANYLGLNGLFTSVLQVLNLAELGVGSAMVFSMYQPIAEDNKEKICALMQLYKKYYRIIGAVVFVGGIAILPVLPYLIKSDLPADINLYTLYLLNLFATVATYWLFAYKNSLLQAHQRVDVANKVIIVTDTCKYILQLGSLAIFKDYYLYTIIILITQIMTNIVTAVLVEKMYPEYKAEGKLPKEEIKIINQKIRDLFTSKLGTVVFNSADTIVISTFLGLSILAVYQNYYFILTSITGIIGVVFSSCTAGIGNSLIVETEEKNYNDLKKFTLMISWIAGFCTVCLLCLYQPFMKIWVTEKLMLNFSAVVCFCIYFFINQINTLLNLYKDAAGMWHEDRFRPLVVSLANLIVNIVLVQFIGIYGVLIASCLTKVTIGIPWILYNLFTVVFHSKPWEYIKNIIRYILIVSVVCLVTYLLCSFIVIDGILGLILRLIVCSIIGNILFLLAFYFDREFKAVILLVQSMLPQRLKTKLNFLIR